MNKYDAAIDRGIALLDAKVPEWCTKMQLEHLHMADGKSCVLGQLFDAQRGPEHENGFGQGCEELNLLTGDDCEEHGFIAPYNEYGALTRRWKQRIRQHCEKHQ